MNDAPIVIDTRRVRSAISKRFNHDVDKYIDYLMTQQAQSSDDRTDSVEQIRQTYPNAYAKWGTEDDLLLKEKFAAGYTVRELSELLGRQEGGIKARLKKLHLLS